MPKSTSIKVYALEGQTEKRSVSIMTYNSRGE